MDKKAEEKLLSIWWFLNLSIIGVCITIGIVMITSSALDVQRQESEVLVIKIIDCISDGANLKPEVLSDTFDVFKDCAISKEIINSGNFYFFINISENGEKRKLIESGKEDYKMACRLKQGSTKVNSLDCYIFDSFISYETQKYKMEIMAVSSHLGKK